MSSAICRWDVDVPPDDCRSMRRAILRLDRSEATEGDEASELSGRMP